MTYRRHLQTNRYQKQTYSPTKVGNHWMHSRIIAQSFESLVWVKLKLTPIVKWYEFAKRVSDYLNYSEIDRSGHYRQQTVGISLGQVCEPHHSLVRQLRVDLGWDGVGAGQRQHHASEWVWHDHPNGHLEPYHQRCLQWVTIVSYYKSSHLFL
mgnify:CR=1 FL=1